MAEVDAAVVRTFIREKGLHGPKGNMPEQGQFDVELVQRADVPIGSDILDSVLCPNQPWAAVYGPELGKGGHRRRLVGGNADWSVMSASARRPIKLVWK